MDEENVFALTKQYLEEGLIHDTFNPYQKRRRDRKRYESRVIYSELIRHGR
jgi:hypothetical protein